MPPCPKCGIANTPERVSCSVCGTPLAAKVPEAAAPSDVLEPVASAPKTIPGVAAEPVQPVPSAPTTMPGVAAQPFGPPRASGELAAQAQGTALGAAQAPADPPKPFKQTMMGIAPQTFAAQRVAASKPGLVETAKLESGTSPLMSPAKPATSPFQTLLGVAANPAGEPFKPKNEAHQTLLGPGKFSKPEVGVQLPAGSNKGTLIGVAVPGIAPINPGVEKVAAVEPRPVPTPVPPKPEPAAPLGIAAFPRRYLALALAVTAAFFGLVTLLAIWWWRATPRLSVVVKTDESGKDSLELQCGNCDDGSRISLAGATAQFVDHHAGLALRQPLHMGDNPVTLELVRRGARPETIQLKVPVDFRVVGDVTGIDAAAPKLRLLVDKSPNIAFEVEGKPLTFDAAGHGQFELDITKDVTGQAPSEKPLQKRISYTAKTPSGNVPGAVSLQVGILPLIIDAPGPLLITDRGEFKLCGNTMAGAAVDVAGLNIEVDKNGRFCHAMLIKELGRFTIWVTASAKNFAPRKVERTIERNADLLAFGKKLYKEIPHELTNATPGSEMDPNALVAVAGNIVELSENPPMTRLLLQPASRRTPEALVRVVATNQPRYTAGQQVTVFGRVTGSLRGPDGRDMPEISAAFLTPGLP